MTVRYTPLPTVVTGDMWTAANHNTYIRDNFAVGCNGLTGAKGDLIVGYDLQDGIRLPVGVDWSALVADTDEEAGLRWTIQGFSASAYNPSSQSISRDQIEKIALPTVIYDPEGLLNEVDDLFTVPTGMGGFWQIMVNGFMTGIAADVGKQIQLGLAVNSGEGTTAVYRWNSYAMNTDGRTVWVCYSTVIYLAATWQVWGIAYHSLSDSRPLSLGRMSIAKMR